MNELYHGIMIADYNGTEYVSLQKICDGIPYCTHHSDMDAPQYVHVDASSDSFCQGTFYYTHHSHMDAPQCVHADVSSDHFCH